MDQEEIDRLLEEALGPPSTSSPRVTPRTLDEVLASRTHVRVLRVLASLDGSMNLTARDVARRAAAEEHPLAGAVRSLFDQERRASEQTSADLDNTTT